MLLPTVDPTDFVNKHLRAAAATAIDKGQKVADVLKRDPGYYGWILQGDFTLHTKKVITNVKLRNFNK